MNVTLRQFRYFIAVADCASVSAAALGIFARDAVAVGLAALRSVVRRDRAAPARLLGGA
jgi:hypothetical protein